ncbi:tRNA pseudouridine(38-40) synthase TruA [Clostridium sp. NSJ-49]|uniref:tRNA pseudouridine(38-40) synthase TruA n=1 Tax=Clostridium sp. NSJ-49 TaxID=2763034 RepID=UPI00164A65F6|nr:tRNA pseudouridine(38-40) synthase TruA [Clostridium sp. NSJ-49]MBC5627109.1 tRNA pseudouridine(38-40) synthase TruA [Clostridium sp. NSJ-49]
MRNIRMIIQYDGSRYKGWQKQNIKGSSVSTIQDKIEKVLSKMTGDDIQVIGCGRTDTGVHADNYVANFKTNSTASISEFKSYLKMYLPEDIVIKDMMNCSERFHSRLNTISKTYKYTIDNNDFCNVFMKNYSYHIEEKLDVNKMIEASEVLIGTHDFRSFTSLKAKNGKSTIRTINYININEKDNIITITINGNGFLLNMVRIIVGTLIEVGKGNLSIENMRSILEEKDRSKAGEKAPAKGLCMLKVEY